jgi:hypothetical protein
MPQERRALKRLTIRARHFKENRRLCVRSFRSRRVWTDPNQILEFQQGFPDNHTLRPPTFAYSGE